MMSYAIAQDEPGSAAPAALSVIVHLLLVMFLYFGVRWQARQADAVVVELWSQLPVMEQPRPEPRAELQAPPKPEPQAPPKIEPKPQKPDIAIEREKKLPKKAVQKKEEPPLKFDARSRIREQLAQEEQSLNQARERQEAAKRSAPPSAPVIDPSYAAMIRTRIKANIVLPPNIPGNPGAEFGIVQLPTGEVLSVTVSKSSGYKVLDDAIERAVLKSSPLPRPNRPEQFQREIQITYRLLD